MDGRRVRSLSCGGGGGGRRRHAAAGGGGAVDTSPPIQSENPFRAQVNRTLDLVKQTKENPVKVSFYRETSIITKR